MVRRRSPLSRFDGARALLAVLTVAAWVCCFIHGATAQSPSPRTALQGQVLDTTGKQVGGALVKLQGHDASNVFETTADVSGSFTFKEMSFGTYTLTAEKSGVRSQAADVVVGSGPPQRTVLVLGSGSTSPAAKPARQEMEFSDKPDFTVAGVTDWTAVGGHGSDATLRTSESLARETLTLKASPGEKTSAKTASGREDKTEASLRQALAVAPESYAANHDLGKYYRSAGQYRQAIPLLQSALTINGSQADDEYELALACRGAGDATQARLHVQRALAQKDSAEFHRLSGEFYEEAGDPLSAVKEMERAVHLNESEENYFAWGSELLLHRAIWEAAEVFQKGAKAHPDSARMKTGWGSALFAGALYDQAARQLCEASDLSPTNTETYLLMGKIELASPAPLPCIEQKLERFMTLQPNNSHAVFLNAMMLAKRDSIQNRQEIETLLTKAVRLDPDDAEASLQLGILSFAQKKYPEAIGFYKQAIAANPQQAEAHYRLGVAYDRIGEPGRARQELQLHDEIEKTLADAVEEERRKIKQFLVVSHGATAPSEKP